MNDGPDGKAYEKAARDVIKWFPRDPRSYSCLMQWYELQGRLDRSETIKIDAKRMLPEIFDVPDAETAAENLSDEAKQEMPLPDKKEELLDLLWNPADPRSARFLWPKLSWIPEP